MRPYFLGVDGGGTKTCFVLTDHDGSILRKHTAGSGYYLQIGMDGLRDTLKEGINAVCDDPSQIEHAFFGLPSYGEDSVQDKVLAMLPRDILGHDRFTCDNDMVCGWAGSLGGKDGINIVAGTGSIAYGEFLGNTARAGGWGELFSDEGSAHWLALKMLNTFTRMCDGRLPSGPLRDIVRDHFSLESDLDICAKILNGSSTRTDIAALSKLAGEAAEAGDETAISLFEEAAEELAEIVETVARSLNYKPGASVPVSYCGGVFNAGHVVLKPFEQALGATLYNFQLQTPLFAPNLGAALYAAKLAGYEALERSALSA